jgi:hypothetical protein
MQSQRQPSPPEGPSLIPVVGVVSGLLALALLFTVGPLIGMSETQVQYGLLMVGIYIIGVGAYARVQRHRRRRR